VALLVVLELAVVVALVVTEQLLDKPLQQQRTPSQSALAAHRKLFLEIEETLEVIPRSVP
jgi:hypothetical protein